MATLAPSYAKRCAIAAPMPREPPVTSATLPLRDWVIFISGMVVQTELPTIVGDCRASVTPARLGEDHILVRYLR